MPLYDSDIAQAKYSDEPSTAGRERLREALTPEEIEELRANPAMVHLYDARRIVTLLLHDLETAFYNVAAAPAHDRPSGSGLVERIESFADLGPNWDSYGAKPLDPALIERAKTVATLLGNLQAAPGSDGSVSFEGYRGKDGIVIAVEPDRVTLYVYVGSFEYEATIPDPADAGVTALSGPSDPDLVLVRKNSGGVSPDGTTNHAIEFGASGSSNPEAVLCGIVVKPFRANCMLPKGHDGEHAPTRPSDPEAVGPREPDIDLPTLAEAIRLWYVETGRNPVTKNWDQPQAGWLIAKYGALRALTEAKPETPA
jgi:hypothetical protein